MAILLPFGKGKEITDALHGYTSTDWQGKEITDALHGYPTVCYGEEIV